GMGAILGGSFRFYLRSGTIAGSWPFLLVLLGAIIFNEYLRQHYERLIFQISFLYLAIFILLIFMMPIVFKSIGTWVFLLSGAISLLLFRWFTLLLKKFAREKRFNQKRVWSPVLIIFFSINVLYFTNLIPPIPLSLKDAG